MLGFGKLEGCIWLPSLPFRERIEGKRSPTLPLRLHGAAAEASGHRLHDHSLDVWWRAFLPWDDSGGCFVERILIHLGVGFSELLKLGLFDNLVLLRFKVNLKGSFRSSEVSLGPRLTFQSPFCLSYARIVSALQTFTGAYFMEMRRTGLLPLPEVGV